MLTVGQTKVRYQKKGKKLSKESLTVRRRIATDDHRTFTANLNGTASFSTKLIALDSFP